MNLNDVITLLNAGYTKAEIDAMLLTDQGTGQAPDQPVPAQDPDPAPAPAAAAPEEPIQGTDQFKALEAKLNQLMGMVQVQNLNTGVDTVPKRTSEDILAQVIAPPRKDLKK